jgi:hypothetical protein
MRHLCPVCGFRGLTEAPRSRSSGGSYEICPSCGFEFGVSDDDLGHTYENWRKAWLAKGMKWYSRGQKQPAEWNPSQQVAAIGLLKSKGRDSTRAMPPNTGPVAAIGSATPAKTAVQKKPSSVATKPVAPSAITKPARKRSAAKK